MTLNGLLLRSMCVFKCFGMSIDEGLNLNSDIRNQIDKLLQMLGAITLHETKHQIVINDQVLSENYCAIRTRSKMML